MDKKEVSAMYRKLAFRLFVSDIKSAFRELRYYLLKCKSKTSHGKKKAMLEMKVDKAYRIYMAACDESYDIMKHLHRVWL